MDVSTLLSEIYARLPQDNTGRVADYIPELGKVSPDKFGVHIITVDEREFHLGDHAEGFSIQSIAKVLSLTMAYQRLNQDLWKRVGVEPSGTPFNSLIQLEQDRGIPRNPMMNAGALVVCDVLLSFLNDPMKELLDFVHTLSGDSTITFNQRVAASERAYSSIYAFFRQYHQRNRPDPGFLLLTLRPGNELRAAGPNLLFPI